MTGLSQPLFAHQRPLERELVPESGILVTNHLNLMYMLSAGLLMPPSGFGSKYYRDTLSCFPGWIPLFINKIFKAAIETATSEADHLKPCLAQVKLNKLSGPVRVLRGHEIAAIDFPTEIDGTEQVVFVPAPLPTAWIESILFRSPAEVTACNRNARDYSNVPWTDFKRKSGKSVFKKALKAAWPPDTSLPEHSTPLRESFAIGGIMAMLSQIANRGDLSVQICRIAFDPDFQVRAMVKDPILAGFGKWLRPGPAREPASTAAETLTDLSPAQELQGQLFWEIVDRIAEWKLRPEVVNAEDVVLDYLKDKSGQLRETRLRQKVLELWKALESLTGLGAVGITEMFERHPTPFSRAMTLFFLHQNCAELLEFQHPLMTEIDWLVSAILFGVRSGWQEFPLELRNPMGLSLAVPHRMAAKSHHVARTRLEIGDSPPRCIPLRELFLADWGKKQQAAARFLAKKRGWDCMQTTIHLNNGTYELRGSRSGMQIMTEGEPAITHEIDRDRFFRNLAKEKIASKEEMEVHKILQI